MTVTVTVPEPPSITVSAAPSVVIPDSLTGMTCTVNDCPGGSCTIAWTMPTAPAADSGSFSAASSATTNYGPTVAGTYDATCTVTDALSQTAVGTTGSMTAFSSSSAIQASFTARPKFQPNCPDPCSVHFDAIGNGTNETTSTVTNEEFRELYFLWDFGAAAEQCEPGTNWDYGTQEPTRYAVGGVASAAFCTAGTHPVTLTVCDESFNCDSETQNVVVTAQDTVFSTANTHCFANDGLDWTGCPLDCAGGDASRCVVTSTFSFSTSAWEGAGQRALLRRGDSFAWSGDSVWGTGQPGGMIDAFGSGAKPIITGQKPTIDFRSSNFTTANLDFNLTDSNSPPGLTELFSICRNTSTCPDGPQGISFMFLEASGYDGAFIDMHDASLGGSGSDYIQRLAVVGVDGQNTGQWTGPGTFVHIWWRAEYSTLQGSRFNSNDGGGYVFRPQHYRWNVWDNVSLLDPDWEPVVSLRGAGGGVRSEALDSNYYNVFSGSHLRQPSDQNSIHIIPACGEGGCNGGTPHANNELMIFERNYVNCTLDGNSSDSFTQKAIHNLLGAGRWVIRNNVYDLQGCLRPTQGIQMVNVASSVGSGGTMDPDGTWVYNNTLYTDETTSGTVTLCNESASDPTPNLRCVNNGAYLPNHSGTFNATVGGTWATGTNDEAASSPFAGAITADESMKLDEFTLSGSDAQWRDQGTDAGPVYDDARRLCRADAGSFGGDGLWDIGAHEEGASECSL